MMQQWIWSKAKITFQCKVSGEIVICFDNVCCKFDIPLLQQAELAELEKNKAELEVLKTDMESKWKPF